MFLFYFSISLAILSITSYHIFQKSVSKNVHPIVALILVYFIALVFSILLLPLFPLKKGLLDSIKEANWAVYLLGIAVFGIEMGYLLAYRSGWKVSIASPVAMVLSTIMIVFAGTVLFKENISVLKIIGIALAIIGIVLLNHK